ncbi:uncharacterized protein LOC127845103 isoform X2 [Dreissena polymorpha]|uniref:uncharacterized protein LOC127845103 isoform X2 n=1 Tax=Dreissena polymorpha TaxID=45954 RepID=UPI002263F08E|nr:uncharacterized protein LOC127845103 isoform X2 [Dreissena polymorpha]
MAADTNIFTDKQTNNWFKACIALSLTKDGLTDFVVTELLNVQTIVGRSCGQCFIQNLIPCSTQYVCKKRKGNNCSFHNSQQRKSCQTCDKVKQDITLLHRFERPSWANTKAELWATDPWEIGKCYLPPDGYSSVSSVQESDFNGVVSIVLNCKHFETCLSAACLSPPPPDKKCPLEKVRQIGRDVRHTADCKVTDADLQYFYLTLTTLLADPVRLLHDTSATEARRKLSDLQNDRLSLDDFGKLLKEANQTLTQAKETGERFSKEAERTLHEGLNTLEATIQAGKDRIENQTQAGEKRIEIKTQESINLINRTVIEKEQDKYERGVAELIKDMKKFYNDNLSHVPISPLNDNVDEKLLDLYMSPKIFSMCKDKGVFTQKNKRVTKYKDVFQTDNKMNRRIFLQGEAGSGKTTFLGKLALEWCKSTSSHMESSKNTDLKTIDDQNKLSSSSTYYEQSDMPCASSATNDDSDTSTASTVTTELSDKSRASFETTEESDISSSYDSFSEDSDSSCYSQAIGHTNNSSNIFADVDALQDYIFVFYITLRNLVKRFEVHTMIKEQIIDSIYSEDDREKAYRLVNEIMKRERCLVLLDGLDEWTGSGDHHNLPTLVSVYNQCVMLITTRPWKLAEGKVKHSEIDAVFQLDGINEPFELSRIILSRLVAKAELEIKHKAFKRYIWNQKLSELISAPMMLSVIVCSYAEGIELKGSKCEIYILLLESLFKKANSEMRTFEQSPSPCFRGTQYIQPNMERLNRLAEMAFHLLFVNAKENSLVFSITELKKFKMDERKQQDFVLKSGILSAKLTASTLRSSSSFMFIHKSMQEFLAAYHIACNMNLIDGSISVYLNRHPKAYLDISQVFIFLCGLDVSCAEKLSSMMDECDALNTNHFSACHKMLNKIILAGLREANANGYSDIALKLSHFYFDNNIIDLHKIWENNAANAIVLNVDTNEWEHLKYQRISPGNDECASQITFDLHSCLKLTYLKLSGRRILGKDSASVGTLEFPVCIILNIADPTQCTELPPVLPSIEEIILTRVTCSCTWLRSLLSMMLTQNCNMKCYLQDCHLTACGEGEANTSYTTGYISVYQNKSISISLTNDTGLWEILHGLSMKSLRLYGWGDIGCRVNHEKSFSQTIASLSKLETLDIKMDELTPCVWEALRGLNIKSLTLSSRKWGDCHAESLTQSQSSLKRLETLGIGVTEDSPGLWKALHGLNIKSLRLDGWKGEGLRINHSHSLSQSLSSLMRLQKLDIHVAEDSTGLWEAFYGLNINKLRVFCKGRVKYKESLSHLLPSLTQLETLSIGADEACPGLWEALQGLSVKSLTIKGMNKGFELNHTELLSQALSSLTLLETLDMDVRENSTGLWEAIHTLNIKTLSLSLCRILWTDLRTESLSKSLSSLTCLETLNIIVLEDSCCPWKALHGLNIKSLSLRLSQIYTCKDLQAESLYQSLASLTQLETLSITLNPDSRGLWRGLHCLNIKRLSLKSKEWGGLHKELMSLSLSSLTQLDTLCIEMECDNPGLWEAVHGLNIKSLSLSGFWKRTGIDVKHTLSMAKTLSSLIHLETLSIDVEHESLGLWEALHGQNIKSLSLSGVRKSSGIDVKHAETFSQSLSSLTQLKTLTLHVHTYIALQVPQSLKYLNIYSDTMLPSKVRELVDSLAIYTHSIGIKLEFGCASSIDPPERIPVQEYIPFQQELAARKNVAIKRFRIYELPDSAGYAMSVRDIDDVDDADSDILEDDVYKRFAKYIDGYKINRISILVEISRVSIS